ncbi:MAG: ATP-binding protein [Chloroflexota bacterium]|nr:ATP-binding protein [Chloroflexota bacterium]
MDQSAVQEVDINRSLETTLRVLAHKLRSVRVSREFDAALSPITARGSELNQVWTNLIDNAADALANQPNSGGQLQVITRSENEFVMVEISDNGYGIPAELQSRIFEPFFTTTGVGLGSGLGLDISYRIVQQHHGSIEVHSEPGNTRFIVRLPVQPPG